MMSASSVSVSRRHLLWERWAVKIYQADCAVKTNNNNRIRQNTATYLLSNILYETPFIRINKPAF